MPYYVYIMTNKPRGVLYTGYTQNLSKRIDQHRTTQTDNFVTRYNLFNLVHVETFDDMMEARIREARIKRWRSVRSPTVIGAAATRLAGISPPRLMATGGSSTIFRSTPTPSASW